MGQSCPKQYLKLNGIPVLTRTVARFLQNPAIDVVQVVIHPDDQQLYAEALADFPLPAPVVGADSRQGSVFNGLKALEGADPDYVLIHDAARPNIDQATIDAVLAACLTGHGALPGFPLVDTIKRTDAHNAILETVDRTGLWAAQTPQGFPFRPLLQAHTQECDYTHTDDASVFEAQGGTVHMVHGSPDNLKITHPQDLIYLQNLHGTQKRIATGTGFDVHAFVPGDHVTLCGVSIPHNARLSGHSDADVAMHALTDALLGAIAAGDIGRHFPPSDNRWKGANSAIFLRFAHKLCQALGGVLQNVDITLICERPKLTPYRAEMVRALSQILQLPPHHINVKGTTTEKLGFTGRKEGIAAQASVAVAF
jgi:2-C-methyl-D-erythritol 4-phosphate cytidylyltransferase/2-C-methyl-D-erythritol 2,4-cyclodiphosphate synthase